MEDSRRNFMTGSLIGAAALGTLGATTLASADTGVTRSTINHYHLPANDKTVHWGYFSKQLPPKLEVMSGDF